MGEGDVQPSPECRHGAPNAQEAPFKELSQQLSEAFIETLRTRRLSFDVLRERFAETSIMDREAVARMCASMAADAFLHEKDVHMAQMMFDMCAYMRGYSLGGDKFAAAVSDQKPEDEPLCDEFIMLTNASHGTEDEFRDMLKTVTACRCWASGEPI